MMFVDPVPDKAIVYTGPSIPELGIQYGDRLDVVLAKLVASTTSTSTQEVDVASAPVSASLFGLGGKSVASAQITTRSFSYSVDKTSDTKGKLSYDIAETKASLPTGYKVLSSKVNVTDSKNQRASTSGTSSTVAINNFPATATFSVGVRTPNGDVQLEKKVFIPSNESDLSTLNFEIQDLVGPTEETNLSVSEAVEVMAAKLVVLSQQVEDLRSQNLALELEKVKAQLSSK